MKSRPTLCCMLILFIYQSFNQSVGFSAIKAADIDYIVALKDTLNTIAEQTDEEYFAVHCQSILSVIEAKSTLARQDSLLLQNFYLALNNTSDPYSMKDFSTYIERRRSLILAWTSPTDGAVSFSWLKLPAGWNPANQYPLYIQLHGLWDVANNTINYLTYPYLGAPSTSVSFEDGYLLSPWGRGNLWYQGISETDIWECIDALKQIAVINPRRMYLSGHSMGGYGAWHIALNSPYTWAALGVHAGALGYNSSAEVTREAAQTLKDLPTYFVCGTNDGLLSINQTAYALLEEAGNNDIKFVTFIGGHEYLEENVLAMYLWMKEYVNDDIDGIDMSVKPENSHLISLRSIPNPFIDVTRLCFTLEYADHVTIEIINPDGQIQDVISCGDLEAGYHEFVWHAESVSAGIYYCRIAGDNVRQAIKLLIR